MLSSIVVCMELALNVFFLVNFNGFPLSGTNSTSRMLENPPGGQSGQRQGRHRSCPNGQLDGCPQSIERGTITHDSKQKKARINTTTTISSPPEQDQRGSPRSQQQLSSIVHPSSSARLCGAASVHNTQILHRSRQPVPDL